MKLLSTYFATSKLSNLKKYLSRGGDPSAIVFAAGENTGTTQWYLENSSHTGKETLRSAALLYVCCSMGLTAHVQTLLEAGANVQGRGATFAPLMGAASANHTGLIYYYCSRRTH